MNQTGEPPTSFKFASQKNMGLWSGYFVERFRWVLLFNESTTMKSPHHGEKRNVLPFEFFLAEGYSRTGGWRLWERLNREIRQIPLAANTRLHCTPVHVLFSGWVYSRRGKEAMRKAQPRSQGLFPGFVENASSPDNNGDYWQRQRTNENRGSHEVLDDSWRSRKRPWHRLVTCPSYALKSWV